MKANKNFAARLISIFLCILLLLVFCGCINFDIPDFPKDSEDFSEDFSEESIPSPEELGLTEESLKNHHYHQLSAEEQELYVAILNSWLEGNDSLQLDNVEFDKLKECFSRIISAVYSDHPECYRYQNGASLKGTVRDGDDNDTVVISWKITAFEENTQAEEEKLECAISEILAAASAGANKYEQVKIVHDHLVNTITYDTSATEGQDSLTARRNSIYSALVEKTAVCGGYARSFQLILDRLGIPCTTVSGTSERNVPHAWSLAMLDGEYYLFDVTWDDSDKEASYTYSAVTTEEMEETHLPNPHFTYPTCTATAYNYFVREGLLLEAYSFEEADRIVSAQKAESDAAFLKFTNKAEYDKAVSELITEQKWTKLTSFQNAKKLSYASDEEKLLLKLYFPN